MSFKRIFWQYILCMVLSAVLFAKPEADYVKGEIIFQVATPFEIIQTENGIIATDQSWFNSLAQQYQIKELEPVFNSSQWKFRRFYQADFDTIYNVEQVVNIFENEFEVVFAEPNYVFELYGIPNDPFFSNQWGLRIIKADSAWQIESGNSAVILGVIDTGTDLLDNNGNPHEDLWANLWNENGMYGYNVIRDSLLPDDDNAHGTHVAGIAGAITNNNTGVAGTAGGGFSGDDGIRILTVKAFRRDGRGTETNIAEGIRWAVDPDDNPATDDGADIINMSFGGYSFSATIDSAIQYADSLGTVLIAAAGNDNRDLDGFSVYPAELPEVIAVAATDSTDTRAHYSNFGSNVEVCSPGGGAEGELNEPDNIFATTPMDPDFYLNDPPYNISPEYAYLAGTSMATPYVSGLAGLLKSYDNTLTSGEIRALLSGTADPIEEQFHDEYAGKLGAGRINAYAALSALQNGISHPNLVYFGREIINDDNGNGILNAGENAELVLSLKNFWENATGVTVTISSENPFVTISDSVAAFGGIPYGEIGSNELDPFAIQLSNSAIPGEYAFRAQVQSGLYFKELTFYIRVYNSLSAGFPVSLTNETVESEPKIADLDGDGQREMAILAKSGSVYIVHGDGQIDPAIYSNAGELVSAPALGDLNGDGDLEIIFSSRNGYLYAIDHTGADLPNFPVNLQNDFVSSPALGDVDGDHDPEIVVGGKTYSSNNVFCIETDGSLKWSANSGQMIEYSPAMGDYDGDGNEDVFCLSATGGTKAIIYKGADGQVLIQGTIPDSNVPRSSPAIGYIDDADTYYDMVLCSYWEPTGSENGDIILYLLNGADLTQLYLSGSDRYLTFPVSDLQAGNPGKEFVSSGYMNFDRFIKIHDKSGEPITTRLHEATAYQFLVSDLDNDGSQEVLSTTDNSIEAFDNQLNNYTGFEVVNTIGEFNLPPVLNDLNNDGLIDITAVNADGDIFNYDHPYSYRSNAHHWPEAQRDMFNSKRYDPPALSGTLSGNTTWSGVVRVSGDITVPSGVTLTIQPGTRVIFQHGDDERGGINAAQPELIVQGTLTANGTAQNRIELFSYSQWQGIVAEEDGQINLSWCWIDRAKQGVRLQSDAAYTHQISDCEISRCEEGIYAANNNAGISGCQIRRNDTGIDALAGYLQIIDNDIHYNTTGVHLYETAFAIS